MLQHVEEAATNSRASEWSQVRYQLLNRNSSDCEGEWAILAVISRVLMLIANELFSKDPANIANFKRNIGKFVQFSDFLQTSSGGKKHLPHTAIPLDSSSDFRYSIL